MSKYQLGIVAQQKGKKWHFIVDKNDVTIGTDSDSSILIHENQYSIPSKHNLFSYNSEKDFYELQIIPTIMKGWLKDGLKQYSFVDLSQSLKIRREKNIIIIPLSSSFKGRIDIGTTVIAFGFQRIAETNKKQIPLSTAKKLIGWVQYNKNGKIRKFLIDKNKVFSIGKNKNSTVEDKGLFKKYNIFKKTEKGYEITVYPEYSGFLLINNSKIKIGKNLFTQGINEKKYILNEKDKAEIKFNNSIIRIGVRETSKTDLKEIELKEISNKIPVKMKTIYNWEKFARRPHDGITDGEKKNDKTISTIINVFCFVIWFVWIIYSINLKIEARGITLSTAEETLERLKESDIMDVSISQDIEALRRGTLGVTAAQETGEGTGEGTGSGTGEGSGSGTGSGAGGGVGTGNTARVTRGLRVLGVGSGNTGPVGLGGGDASVQDLLAGGASLSGVSGGAASAAGGTGGLGGGVTGTVGVSGGGEVATGPAHGGDLQHQRTAGVRGGSIGGVSGDAAASGARDAGSVRRTVVRYQGRLKYYYEKELEINPSAQGKIVARITIAENGSVTNVSMVSSSLGSPRLEQQILGAIRSWQFPAIDAGSGSFTFTVPLNFYSQ